MKLLTTVLLIEYYLISVARAIRTYSPTDVIADSILQKRGSHSSQSGGNTLPTVQSQSSHDTSSARSGSSAPSYNSGSPSGSYPNWPPPSPPSVGGSSRSPSPTSIRHADMEPAMAAVGWTGVAPKIRIQPERSSRLEVHPGSNDHRLTHPRKVRATYESYHPTTVLTATGGGAKVSGSVLPMPNREERRPRDIAREKPQVVGAINVNDATGRQAPRKIWNSGDYFLHPMPFEGLSMAHRKPAEAVVELKGLGTVTMESSNSPLRSPSISPPSSPQSPTQPAKRQRHLDESLHEGTN